MKASVRVIGATLGALSLLVGGSVRAQTPPAATTPPSAAAVRQAAAPLPVAAPAPVPREGASARDIEQVREDVRNLGEHMQTQIGAMRPPWWERFVPALMGLLGVLVGGWVSWRLQSRQLRLSAQMQQQQLLENERLGRAKAGYESYSKVVEYQTRQLNEFYSPLRLMLQRSGGVRRQLCDQLRAKRPERFEMRQEADGREHLYILESDGEATPFRLIRHMHELATQHAELLPLVQEIVTIGEAMTNLIRDKGGMAITGSGFVNDLLGRYSAHFSILRDVAAKAKDEPDLLSALEYNVAYPRELDGALDADIAVLTGEIESWRTLSRRMWEQASEGAPAAVAR